MAAPSGCRQMTGVAVGSNGAGALTVTGAVVGDIVQAVIGQVTATAGPVAVPAGAFERVVTVADQVQQISAANLSANTYHFVLLKA